MPGTMLWLPIRRCLTQSTDYRRIDGIDSPSIIVRLIDGGINTNVIPDTVTFLLDHQMIPQENAEAVFGTTIPVNGVPLYADARLYMQEGITNSVRYGYGPPGLLEANGLPYR